MAPCAPASDGDAMESEVRSAARAISLDRKSTRLNSSHLVISYAVFCLKKKKETVTQHSKPPHLGRLSLSRQLASPSPPARPPPTRSSTAGRRRQHPSVSCYRSVRISLT